MIKIYLNDICHHIERQTLQEFLGYRNEVQTHFAVAINQQFIPRTDYDKTLLTEGDRVDMIIPMQGG